MYPIIMEYLKKIAENEDVSIVAYFDEDELQYSTYRNGSREVELFIPDDFKNFCTEAANLSMDFKMGTTVIKKLSEIM